MERVYNFSAGPSMLPESVLKRAADEMLNYQGSGQSVMEMSHRSKVYEAIIAKAEALVRELMGVPDAYDVLFLQGGASLQFAMVPMNLMKLKKAVYVDTGNWSTKAIEEARKFGEVTVAASSKDKTYTYIPALGKLGDGTDYVHITSNNTIYGTRYTSFPDTGKTPLVADMSSNIMSEPADVPKFGLIYAGAQKNLGPAGVTLVIIRKDLVGDTLPGTPTMLSYKIHADNKSLYNTPPCYGVYIVELVLEWLKDLGGITAMAEINKKKAGILYDFLDSSKLFRGTVEKKDRSLMNIPFVCPTEELNAAFLKEADAKGFVNLKGHRTVGGMRASIYNAMPVEGVQKLVDFMKDFEKRSR
jgi:phosphoserine aminotransferase